MHNYVREIVRLGDTPKNINKFYWASIPYLAKKFFPDKNLSILEIGVGSGHCILPLKKYGYKKLFAVDIDPFNLSFFVSKGIKCVQADVSCGSFPFKEASIDVIILFHLLEHLVNADVCLSQISRLLKRKGILMLSTPDWRKQYKLFFSDPTHVHPYDKKSILWLLRCFNFKPVLIRNFGVIKGLGRLWPLYGLFKSLMFTGINIIAIAQK